MAIFKNEIYNFIDKIKSPIMVLDNLEKIPHTSTNNITASKILIESTKSPIFGIFIQFINNYTYYNFDFFFL